MTCVKIPTPFRRYANGQSQVVVEGGTVRELLLNLSATYPSLGLRLWDGSENVRRFVRLFVSSEDASAEDIRFRDKLATPLRDGDELIIVPAVAGGAA